MRIRNSVPFAGLAASLLLSACVTQGEQAREDAFARCGEIADRGVRQTCMTRAIEQSQADRREELAKDAEESAKRERDAAVNEAYGAPDSSTRDF